MAKQGVGKSRRVHAAAEFDDQLLAHMEQCWNAECKNAERLNGKVNFMTSGFALLFGLGLFKIDWSVPPGNVSSIECVWALWMVRIVLVLALGCLGFGLYQALTKIKDPNNPEGVGNASDLMRLPPEIAKSPPRNELESRAVRYYLIGAAVEELVRQNAEKTNRLRRCRRTMQIGLGLVFIAVVTYLLASVPPMRPRPGELKGETNEQRIHRLPT